MAAVQKVLATLGYGDAIGHEVMGIQRVLRAAGHDSEIFVETADPRLEHLTRDYRDLIDASSPEDLRRSAEDCESLVLFLSEWLERKRDESLEVAASGKIRWGRREDD